MSREIPTSGKGSYSRCIKLTKYQKGVLALMGNRAKVTPFNPTGRTDRSIYKEMLVKLAYEETSKKIRQPKQTNTSDEV